MQIVSGDHDQLSSGEADQHRHGHGQQRIGPERLVDHHDPADLMVTDFGRVACTPSTRRMRGRRRIRGRRVRGRESENDSRPLIGPAGCGRSPGGTGPAGRCRQRADTFASVNPAVVSGGCDPSQIRLRETRSLHDAVLRPRRQGAVAVNGDEWDNRCQFIISGTFRGRSSFLDGFAGQARFDQPLGCRSDHLSGQRSTLADLEQGPLVYSLCFFLPAAFLATAPVGVRRRDSRPGVLDVFGGQHQPLADRCGVAPERVQGSGSGCGRSPGGTGRLVDAAAGGHLRQRQPRRCLCRLRSLTDPLP